MNRRGFLKGVAAAPVVAPMLADSVTKAVQGSEDSILGYKKTPTLGGLTKFSDAYDTIGGGEPINNSQYLKNELQRLTQHLIEVNSDEVAMHGANFLSTEMRASFYADSLKSVSKMARVSIMQEEKKRLDKAETKYWIEKRIAEVKKELGLLGVFL